MFTGLRTATMWRNKTAIPCKRSSKIFIIFFEEKERLGNRITYFLALVPSPMVIGAQLRMAPTSAAAPPLPLFI
ncbi:hypothetical protein L6164_034612 [Bauhinia variegata]|uniref:Uncharacterized protein n=1 Tax=Bauhinia variegata TaxID=167791 RepID=A0ACB9KV90_BAUVA|nr:hypothetical protein L6164_034612 [Bauhinia variegata]